MKQFTQAVFSTSPTIGIMIARLTLGIVLFPHGAQKLLGLFGGYGYSGTMEAFTSQMGLPAFVAFSVIMIEFIGSISLLLGFASRFWAISLIGMFIGIIATTQWEHGFFMNWYGNQAGEGFEFSLLILGLSLSVVLNGSGKWSLDHFISKK